jgi:hypothetical protein
MCPGLAIQLANVSRKSKGRADGTVEKGRKINEKVIGFPKIFDIGH